MMFSLGRLTLLSLLALCLASAPALGQAATGQITGTIEDAAGAVVPGTSASVSNNTELGRGDAIISVNGQRTTSNSVRINGVDANSVGTNSTPNIAVPATDSLQEFVVQTSLYDASQGRNAGGNVEAITKSGGARYHGNIYEFLRNDALNANDFFLNAAGCPRPVLTRNQFGGTIGGPVVREKAFFFASYQGTRARAASFTKTSPASREPKRCARSYPRPSSRPTAASLRASRSKSS
jgi:hypothetical protein